MDDMYKRLSKEDIVKMYEDTRHELHGALWELHENNKEQRRNNHLSIIAIFFLVEVSSFFYFDGIYISIFISFCILLVIIIMGISFKKFVRESDEIYSKKLHKLFGK